MKRIRLPLLLAALCGVVAFVAPLDGGRPLFDFRRVAEKVLGDAPRIRRSSGRDTGGVYKWRDGDGSWHYGNVPPAGRDDVQRVEGEVTWASGSGGEGDAEARGSGGERPRNAAGLLAESRRLEGTTGARETELERGMKEAQE